MPAAVSFLLTNEQARTRAARGDGLATQVAGCDFSFVRDRAGFDALEEEWNGLFERAGRSAQLFQGFNWLWHWCNHYLDRPEASGRGAQLAIVTARRKGRLVMVWPLVRSRAGGITKLSWMGEPVSQYGDVLIDEVADADAILRGAWKFIVSHSGADVVLLRKVRADAAVAPLLPSVGGIATEKLEAPYLDLASAPSFAEYEKRYSSGARRNRKRQRRRLEERGAVEVEAWTHGARASELARMAIDLKRVWLAERGLVSAAFADNRIGDFFADVTLGGVRPAGCRVLALTCGGAPVALEIGLTCKDRAAIHVIAYDRAYEKAAAGALLMEESIRRSCEAGLATFDLLAPAAPYKADWADGTVEVCDWVLPLTVAGHIYGRVYFGFLRNLVKKALAVSPNSLRRVVTSGLGVAPEPEKPV